MVYIHQFLHKAWSVLLQIKQNGRFRFIGANALKATFYYALVVVGVIIIGKFLLDLNHLFHSLSDHFSTGEVLTIFFISESLLGMIPPDLFMLWAEKFDNPVAMLTLLGVLSYVGGIVSYFIGSWISRREKVKAFIERRLQRYVVLTEKWGGTFLALSAIFPFSPYAMVALAVSVLRYPFPKLLLYGLFRIARFVGQGIMLFQLTDIKL